MPLAISCKLTGVVPVLPNTRYERPAVAPLPGLLNGAPMITSPMPSPFTSPALATLFPLWSSVHWPLMTKPPVPLATSLRLMAVLLLFPNTTYERPALLPAAGSLNFAPMIKSAKPSPFTSPALATLVPLQSRTHWPMMTKPLVPLPMSDRLTGVLAVLPNTT